MNKANSLDSTLIDLLLLSFQWIVAHIKSSTIIRREYYDGVVIETRLLQDLHNLLHPTIYRLNMIGK